MERDRERIPEKRCCGLEVKHFIGNEEIGGSIPLSSSNNGCGFRDLSQSAAIFVFLHRHKI